MLGTGAILGSLATPRSLSRVEERRLRPAVATVGVAPMIGPLLSSA